MVEQRYQAVLAVISDGLSITQVASKVGVSRQTLHAWLARYEAEGLDGLADRSHRPAWCPHQMPAEVEATVLELRRSRPYRGPRRLVFELAKRKVAPLPSASAVYRALLRAGLIDPRLRDRRARKWKRWERATPMELWQMDVVGGFPLANGTSAKALTGIDDHSRMCVCARLMVRERTRAVCDGLREALATYGAPEQILTDNGKVFTGRLNHPPVEVLFDAICREHGIEHLLTQPRTPTTTGKIERFHPQPASRVPPHRSAFRQPEDRPGGVGCMGVRVQHRSAASVVEDGHPGRTIHCRCSCQPSGQDTRCP